jgi:hypothetical protein
MSSMSVPVSTNPWSSRLIAGGSQPVRSRADEYEQSGRRHSIPFARDAMGQLEPLQPTIATAIDNVGRGAHFDPGIRLDLVHQICGHRGRQCVLAGDNRSLGWRGGEMQGGLAA